jgi:Helix-turn-helix domain
MKPKENQASNTAEERWIIHPKYKDRSSFSITECAEILGVSKWCLWYAAKRGDLPVVTIGRRKIVPRVRLERLMNGSGS